MLLVLVANVCERLKNWCQLIYPTLPWLQSCVLLPCVYDFEVSYVTGSWLLFKVHPHSVFLSRFWVSKWHPKIMQWHPKFWKPRYGFALYRSKTNGGKHVFLHVATATDGCNCKLGICALSWAPPRFGLLLYCRRFLQYQYGVQSWENTLKETLQLWKCFTVSPLRSACLVMHQATRTKSRQLQRAFKTRWLSSEAAVRIRSEILAIWAALKQLSEDKSDAMCVVLLRLMKTKNFNMLLSFFQHWHLTWQNWAKFFKRDILTLHRWKLPLNCASISSLMSLLNPSLKLTAKRLIVNLGNLERRMVVCQVP